jgi:hypothetical protein
MRPELGTLELSDMQMKIGEVAARYVPRVRAAIFQRSQVNGNSFGEEDVKPGQPPCSISCQRANAFALFLPSGTFLQLIVM